MTSPISGLHAYTVTPTSKTTDPATTKTGTTGSKSILDPQAFLQLLVAQLKYQDPSNPTDTSSFMNQTAMLSQVQTMGTMSSTLNALAAAQEAQTATTMIGKQVTYLDAKGVAASGIVSSAALAASGATLQVGAVSVPLADITGVAAPTTTAPTTT